jgi:microcystin degradation protein MlrC
MAMRRGSGWGCGQQVLRGLLARLACGLLAMGSAVAAAGEPPAPRAAHRIAVMHWVHETTTFVDRPTDRAVFEAAGPPLVGAEVLQASPYTEGFARMARLLDLQPVGITSPRTPYEVSSTGWIPEETFAYYLGLMERDLRAQGPFDGVYFAFHGAMAVAGVPRPEAEVFRRVRAIVGDAVPMVVSYDLHGNEDEETARYVNAVMGTKRFPHYDDEYMGRRSAIFLKQVLADGYVPTIAARKIPIILPTVRGDTSLSPVMDIMERARIWEEQQPETYVSVLLGYPWSDVPDVGMSLFVTSNGDQALADAIADDMVRFIWNRREQFALRPYAKVDAAVAQALQAQAAGETPIILADYSDRLGDATWALAELLAQGAQRFLVATVADAAALAEIARDPTPGRTLDLAVGGTLDDSSGSPVRVRGVLESVTALDTPHGGAVIDLGAGNRLILTRILRQLIYPEQIQFYGVDDRAHDIIVLKTRVHFRRGFNVGDYAQHAIPFEPQAPYLGTVHVDQLDYRNIPPGLYPIQR